MNVDVPARVKDSRQTLVSSTSSTVDDSFLMTLSCPATYTLGPGRHCRHVPFQVSRWVGLLSSNYRGPTLDPSSGPLTNSSLSGQPSTALARTDAATHPRAGINDPCARHVQSSVSNL